MNDDKARRPSVTPLSPSLPLPPPKADSVAGSPASPEEALAAAQRIKQCGSSCIDGSHPVGRGERLDPPPQSGHITDELVRANDLSVVGLSPRLLDIEKFFPDWRKHKAEALLKVLSERYSIDPSVKNSLLLQQAVNRLTSGGAITSRVHDEIQKAIKVLHRKPDALSVPRADI